MVAFRDYLEFRPERSIPYITPNKKNITSNDRSVGAGPGERSQQHIAVQISIAVNKTKFLFQLNFRQSERFVSFTNLLIKCTPLQHILLVLCNFLPNQPN